LPPVIEAIVSDIHSNLEALSAVLEDMEKRDVGRIVCLGDIIGYGASPRECLDVAMERFEVCLLGNHEFAVLHDSDGFNPIAERAVEWTRWQLRRKEYARFLCGLVSARLEGNFLYVHGSVRAPLMEYVREAEDYASLKRGFKVLREEFKLFDICFTGHNHRAFMSTDVGLVYPHPVVSRFPVKGEKLYVCAGSVGQPRDDDPRACYVIYDGECVENGGAPYEGGGAAAKIRAAGLHEFLAERLFLGQ